MTHPGVSKSCPYSRHSGPVGCLPAPNIFHLANEFAKGKMFWNYDTYKQKRIAEKLENLEVGEKRKKQRVRLKIFMAIL